MSCTGCQPDHIRADIGGFHAQHAAIILVVQVCHVRGDVRPRIPDDCTPAAPGMDVDHPVIGGIVNLKVTVHAGVDSVDFRVDGQCTYLDLLPATVDLVDTASVLQSSNGGPGNIAHR
jgi:hypothetical protein